jgi:hypothetical protein
VVLAAVVTAKTVQHLHRTAQQIQAVAAVRFMQQVALALAVLV